MSQYAKDVGQRIKEARELKGLSQTQLGNLIGVKYRQISGYESGSVGLSLETAESLAASLGVPLINLLFPGETPKPVKVEMTDDEILARVIEWKKAATERQRDCPADPDHLADLITVLRKIDPKHLPKLRSLVNGFAKGAAIQKSSEKAKDTENIPSAPVPVNQAKKSTG